METGSVGSESGAPVAPVGPMIPVVPQVPASHVRRAVLVLAGVILAVAAISLLIVALSTRPAASYPAGSPEAAFQGYLSAWEAGDLDTAYGYFSERIRAEATLDDFRMMDDSYGWARQEDRRVVLTGTRVDGDTASLDLRVDQFSSGGFGGGDVYSWETSVPLVHENGSWHVDDYLSGLEPMPLEKW